MVIMRTIYPTIVNKKLNIPVNRRPSLSHNTLPTKYDGASAIDCKKKFKNGFPLKLDALNTIVK